MTPAATVSAPNQPVQVPLKDVEHELSRQLKILQGEGEEPVQRARMSNLVVFCNSRELGERIADAIPEVVSVHPARVLLLIGESKTAGSAITATVHVRPQRLGSRQQCCSEQVTLAAAGHMVDRLPFAVRALLVGDLPVNLWWAVPQPPPLAGALLYELGEYAQQIMYDSLGWPEPARGVVATATWLEQVERTSGSGRWRVASDLNWRRLKYWRRVVAQALDPASAPGAAESVKEILIEHGPHAVVQGWELVSWLTRRLGWKVRGGRVQPGVEIGWQFTTPHGEGRVRIRRLEQGPPEIRRVRMTCTLDNKSAVLNLVVEGEHRLAILLEGIEAAPRTVTVPPQSPAELVGRQLSDRERDPVFRESMAVAGVLAQSVAG
ncbi:MAG: glucose-6-phosphate dehydrogenase assembly protein OpcA [Gemmataceae bacterium]|nr:glucose-6-phosphate dehydrogenase assembly protein OpcA [Gemmataceae bacterium]